MIELSEPRTIKGTGAAAAAEKKIIKNPAGRTARIIPVAGGKGGVGKTMFVSNLGIQLARNGYRTCIIDLDIGGSNLHTYMGIKNTSPGIGDFLLAEKGHLSNYPITTSVNNLSLITGDQLIPGLSSVKRAARKRLITEIFELNFDFILLDLGSGTYSMVTDFFLLSNRGICVTAPEHGAILNTFAFLKNIVFRLFQLNFISEEARDVLEEARIRDETGKFPSFWDILNWLAENNKESAFYFKTMLEKIKPAIVFNMVEAPTDIKYLSDLTSLVYSKLIVETDILGYIVRHKMIAQSVKSRMPLSIQNPSLRAVQNIGKMSERLIANRLENKPLFDVGKYASSLDETAARLRSAPEFEQKNSEKKGMASAQTQSRKFKPGTRSTSANALQKSLINRSQPLPSHMSKSGSGLAQRLFGHPSVDRQMKKSLQQLMSGRLPLSL